MRLAANSGRQPMLSATLGSVSHLLARIPVPKSVSAHFILLNSHAKEGVRKCPPIYPFFLSIMYIRMAKTTPFAIEE